MITDEPQNPYAPPTSDINPKTAAPVVPTGELATRWQRLGGSVVDVLIQMVAVAPAFFGVSMKALAKARKESSNPFLLYTMAGTLGLVAAAAVLALQVLQSILMARRGQTIGKIVAGTRIVKLDGLHPSFLSTPVLRYWLLVVLNLMPKLNMFISFVDAVFIYRHDRRCLHDLIAGTKVVRLAAKSTA